MNKRAPLPEDIAGALPRHKHEAARPHGQDDLNGRSALRTEEHAATGKDDRALRETPYVNPIARIDGSVSGVESSLNALNPIELQSVSQNRNNYGTAADHYGVGPSFRTIDKKTTKKGTLTDIKIRQGSHDASAISSSVKLKEQLQQLYGTGHNPRNAPPLTQTMD